MVADAGEAGTSKETKVKIENILKSTATPRSKSTRTAQAPLLQSTEPTVSDDVQLTATAEKMSQLEGNLSSVEVSDRAKIDAIRKQISEGRFKVDEEAVAESLVQETIANISRRAGRLND
jgi:flagellar biosynthesis anti-sigma factor FlgM